MFSAKNNVVETFRVVIDGAGGLTVSDTSGVVNIFTGSSASFCQRSGRIRSDDGEYGSEFKFNVI